MRLLMFALGVAMGQVFVPAQAAAFASISPEATGRASTVFNVSRQLGSAAGVAVFTTAIVAVGAVSVGASGAVRPNLAAYHVAFLVAAAIAVAGGLLALTIHDADAASTIVRRPRQRAQPAQPAARP
jgi:MFS family permease